MDVSEEAIHLASLGDTSRGLEMTAKQWREEGGHQNGI